MMPGAPTVYFIDDSATMREVIKIAFRRERINVVACHDGASALAQMERQKPDVVISDVIMPDQDGYQVCEQIKQHPQLNKTPVILMSGVVNRAVAERAFAVKADELIRKPFQPQDLLSRVQHLLRPRTPAAAISANAALSSIFAMSANHLAALSPNGRTAHSLGVTAPAKQPCNLPAAVNPAPLPSQCPTPQTQAPNGALPVDGGSRPAPSETAPRMVPAPSELQKIKLELQRLHGLVRKLRRELEAEREYCRALEAHIKTLQEE
jgi:CheY-like chemotaxis protein